MADWSWFAFALGVLTGIALVGAVGKVALWLDGGPE